MKVDISQRDSEESVYHLGYELIQKQLKGIKLSESEAKFIEYIYFKIDQQIQRLMRKTIIQ